MKHRIIIHLGRSKGNDRCTVNERMVLPRMLDVIKRIQDVWRHRGEAGDKPDFQIELMGCDLAVAYCHLGVVAEERGRCLAPHPDGERVILFKAMLFGFKAVPLVMDKSKSTSTTWR